LRTLVLSLSFTIFVGQFSIKLGTVSLHKTFVPRSFSCSFVFIFGDSIKQTYFGQLTVFLISQFWLWVYSLCFAEHEVYKLSRHFQIHFVLAVTSTGLCNIFFRNCESWLSFLSIRFFFLEIVNPDYRSYQSGVF